MATVAEQWVLVEMVQALYEVSLATSRAYDHTQPWGSGTFCVDFCAEGLGGPGPVTPGPSASLPGTAHRARLLGRWAPDGRLTADCQHHSEGAWREDLDLRAVKAAANLLKDEGSKTFPT